MEEENKRFLPIGTVVLLKGGKKEVMITGYCIVPKGAVFDKNGKVDIKENQIFDYGACMYPEGVIASEQLFAFNHDQVEKICYMGFQTDGQKDLSAKLNAALTEVENAKTEQPKEQPKEGQE